MSPQWRTTLRVWRRIRNSLVDSDVTVEHESNPGSPWIEVSLTSGKSFRRVLSSAPAFTLIDDDGRLAAELARLRGVSVANGPESHNSNGHAALAASSNIELSSLL
jgi:hypothetical protein